MKRLGLILIIFLAFSGLSWATELRFEPSVGLLGHTVVMHVENIPLNVHSIIVDVAGNSFEFPINSDNFSFGIYLPEWLKPGYYTFTVYSKIEYWLPKNLYKKVKMYDLKYLLCQKILRIMPYYSVIYDEPTYVELSLDEIKAILKAKLGYLPEIIAYTNTYYAYDLSVVEFESINQLHFEVKKETYKWPFDCDDFASFTLINLRRLLPRVTVLQVYGIPEWTGVPHAFNLIIDKNKELYIYDGAGFLGRAITKYIGQYLGISEIFLY